MLLLIEVTLAINLVVPASSNTITSPSEKSSSKTVLEPVTCGKPAVVLIVPVAAVISLLLSPHLAKNW